MPARTLALFISDLHLQPSYPHTCAAFFSFLEERAMAAQALYLLGDVFEYWAGDDDIDLPFHQEIVRQLRRVSDAGVAVYWLHGNRDFLVGGEFANAAGLTILAEPHVESIGGLKVTLVHGDAECTGDDKYMAFRAQVRDPAWQAQFLGMPLAQRKAIIAGMREGSKAAHAGKTMEIMDVAPAAVAGLHESTASDIIIHGHTHRPALHDLGGKRRYVLPDWEIDALPPRGGWISITSDGAIQRFDVDGRLLD